MRGAHSAETTLFAHACARKFIGIEPLPSLSLSLSLSHAYTSMPDRFARSVRLEDLAPARETSGNVFTCGSRRSLAHPCACVRSCDPMFDLFSSNKFHVVPTTLCTERFVLAAVIALLTLHVAIPEDAGALYGRDYVDKWRNCGLDCNWEVLSNASRLLGVIWPRRDHCWKFRQDKLVLLRLVILLVALLSKLDDYLFICHLGNRPGQIEPARQYLY